MLMALFQLHHEVGALDRKLPGLDVDQSIGGLDRGVQKPDPLRAREGFSRLGRRPLFVGGSAADTPP
jgi:hypothetical protein